VSLRLPSSAPRSPRTRAGMVLDAVTAVPIWLVSPIIRPWHLRWGATTAEVVAAMPGDDIVPRAQFNATRAIDVAAPPAQVWPWIAQLGYRRGGFYTYDLLDNAGQRSADRVQAEHQELHVNLWLMELGDFAMERRMLKGIKGRAESAPT
jgi:hypothetical protein